MILLLMIANDFNSLTQEADFVISPIETEKSDGGLFGQGEAVARRECSFFAKTRPPGARLLQPAAVDCIQFLHGFSLELTFCKGGAVGIFPP